MPESRKNDSWLSVPKAARALGISKLMVLSLATRGELDTMVADDRTFVSRNSIDSYVARRATASAASA
jgi:hypothetical protein